MGRMSSNRIRSSPLMIFRYFVLLIAVLVAVFPYIWVLMSSLKPDRQLMTIPPSFSFTPTLKYYQLILKDELLPHLYNTVIIAFISTTIAVAISSLAGYGLTRFKYRGREFVAYSIFAVRFLPFIALLIPLYVIMNDIGLSGTKIGMIFAFQLMHIPWMTWLMRSFFFEIPLYYEEAAMLEGLTKWGVFFRISLPMVVPALATAMVLGLIFAWNQYFIPLMLGGRYTKTLTIGLYRYVGSMDNPILFGQLAAWATVTVSPVIIASLVVRKYIIKAFTGGTVV